MIVNEQLRDTYLDKSWLLEKAVMYRLVAIWKPLVSRVNAQMHNQQQGALSLDPWAVRKVIWVDESSFTLFQISRRGYIWCKLKDASHGQCLLVWIGSWWDSFGPRPTHHRHTKAKEYEACNQWGKCCYPVMLQKHYSRLLKHYSTNSRVLSSAVGWSLKSPGGSGAPDTK